MPALLKLQEEGQQSSRLTQKARSCCMQMEPAFSLEILRFEYIPLCIINTAELAFLLFIYSSILACMLK